MVESCSKLGFSITEHLVEVVDKLSTTAVVFFRFERILKCKHLLSMLRCMLGSVKGVKSENPKGEGEIRKWENGGLLNIVSGKVKL